MILFIVCQSLSPREMQNWNRAHRPSSPHNKTEMARVTLVNNKVQLISGGLCQQQLEQGFGSPARD